MISLFGAYVSLGNRKGMSPRRKQTQRAAQGLTLYLFRDFACSHANAEIGTDNATTPYVFNFVASPLPTLQGTKDPTWDPDMRLPNLIAYTTPMLHPCEAQPWDKKHCGRIPSNFVDESAAP